MSPFIALFLLACASTVRGADVPHYTEMLQAVDGALTTLKQHLTAVPPIQVDPNNHAIQYLMILNTVNDLVGKVATGSDYNGIYFSTVQKSILSTSNDPHAAVNRVRHQLDGGNSKIALMRDLVRHKQQTACGEPVSRNCDMIINIAVNMSPDKLLKSEAHFLITVGEVAKEFLNKFNDEFVDNANVQSAVQYLVNGQQRLHRFVDMSAKAIQEGDSIDPTTAMRTTFYDDDDYSQFTYMAPQDTHININKIG